MSGWWDPEELCAGCPGQVLGLGEFDVAEKPDSSQHLFVRTLGDGRVGGRVLIAHPDIRVCVHPWRVRLPVGAYASAGVSVPEIAPADDEVATLPPRDALNPPTEVEDLHAWLTATLRLAGPAGLDSALDEAQSIAFDRFPQDTVLGALRDVLGRELARPNRPLPAPRSRGGQRR